MSIEHLRQEQAARYAAFLRERFETKGMLAELAEYPNFVVWRYSLVDGQRKKPPFNPNTHQSASPIEPRTWGNVESALDALATGQFHCRSIRFLSHWKYVNAHGTSPIRSRLCWITKSKVPSSMG